MKFEINQKIIALSFILAFTMLIFSCQSGQSTGSAAQTPTEAYKMLYAAVKSKDTDKIKQLMSKDSHGLAQMQAAQSKQTVEQVFSNGFTETTFSAALPQIRNERVKDDFGAIEVWNEKQRRWDDLPFIKEEGSWKLAVGNLFRGNYESPGKSQSIVEAEAANAVNPNHGMIMNANVNANGNNIPIKKVPIPQQPPASSNVNGAANK